MKLKNSNYNFEPKDPIFSHGGKTFNAHHLSDEQVKTLIVEGCKLFSEEKIQEPAIESITDEPNLLEASTEAPPSKATGKK